MTRRAFLVVLDRAGAIDAAQVAAALAELVRPGGVTVESVEDCALTGEQVEHAAAELSAVSEVTER